MGDVVDKIPERYIKKVEKVTKELSNVPINPSNLIPIILLALEIHDYKKGKING